MKKQKNPKNKLRYRILKYIIYTILKKEKQKPLKKIHRFFFYLLAPIHAIKLFDNSLFCRYDIINHQFIILGLTFKPVFFEEIAKMQKGGKLQFEMINDNPAEFVVHVRYFKELDQKKLARKAKKKQLKSVK